MRLRKMLWAAPLLLSLVACGGSGTNTPVTPEEPGSSSSASPPPVTPVSFYASLPANANPAAADMLFAAWKDQYFRTVEQEIALGQDVDAYLYEGSSNVMGSGRILFDKSSCAYEGQCTVSEGIGYGMIIAVMQNDVELFNRLWLYSRAFRSDNLMDWKISTFVSAVGPGSATDADLDIATALIIASQRWGDASGYLADAIAIATSIWNYEINKANLLILPGNTPMWTTDGNSYNPSYFSPVAFRLFAQIDPDPTHNWKAALDANYAFMEAINAAGAGLFPDWTDAAGQPAKPPNGAGASTYMRYYLESVRVPWRMAWDYAWFNEPRAKTILTRMANYTLTWTGGDPDNVRTKYPYVGTPSESLTNGGMAEISSLCATGMAGPEYADWLAKCTEKVNSTRTEKFNYFHHILQVMYAQLLNGKYVIPQ